jgi:hypothetical protein
MCFLFFFVGVTEDDDLTIVGRPQEITIELAEETLGELEVTSVSWMGSSSSEDEDRSTTRAFSEGPPCSNTDERGLREDTSAGDPRGDGVSDGVGGGVLALLAAGFPSMEGERSRLMSVLSSIVGKRRTKKETLSKKEMKKRNARWHIPFLYQ